MPPFDAWHSSPPPAFANPEIFRFPYGNSFILFMQNELLLIGSIPSFWVLLIAASVGGLFQFVLPQIIKIPWLGPAIFIVGVVADVIMRIAGRIGKRTLSKLSNEELIEKSSKIKSTHLPWSEIREINLDTGSLTVMWGYGIRRKTLRLKFDKSKFEQLRLFVRV